MVFLTDTHRERERDNNPKPNKWKIATLSLVGILLILFFVPLGKADLSLGNQFIQLILQSGQTQDPFTISNATGSTLAKIDVNGNAFTQSLNATNITAKNIGGVIYADQYATIQSAIDTATTYMKVFVPSGTYPISSCLTGKNNLYLQGAGESSVLNVTGANNAICFNNVTNFHIEGFRIQGNNLGTTGINISASSQNIVDTDALKSIHILGFTKDGVYFNNNVVGLRASNILSELNGEDGFDIMGSDNTFANSEARSNNGEGWRWGGTAQTLFNVIGAGNTLNGLNDGTQDSQVFGGYFDRNRWHGVYAGGSNNTYIGGHAYFNNGTNLGSGYSIQSKNSIYIGIRSGRTPITTEEKQQFNIYVGSLAYGNKIISPNLQASGALLGNLLDESVSGSQNTYLQTSGKGINHGNSATAPTPFGAGDTFYNTSSNKMAYYNGTNWIQYP